MGREPFKAAGQLEGPSPLLSGIFDLSAVPQAEVRFGDFLDQVCSRMGFDFATYAGTNPVDGSIHVYTNYPEPWKDHYRDAGFHRLDPTILTASRSIAPVDWRRLKSHGNFRKVFREAHDFGISELGVTIPVRGPYGDVGMLSVTRVCDAREWDGQTLETWIKENSSSERFRSLLPVATRPIFGVEARDLTAAVDKLRKA